VAFIQPAIFAMYVNAITAAISFSSAFEITYCKRQKMMGEQRYICISMHWHMLGVFAGRRL